MEEINLNRREFRKLKNSESIIPNKRIYINNKDLYKIYNFGIKNTYIFTNDFFVDENQIERLSDLRKYVSLSHLPRGIIKYNDESLGVLYDYFEGYKSFVELYKEDINIIFDNIRYAIEAMNELIFYDIYNSDLINQNILYKGKEVELIDLDGRLVSSYPRMLTLMYRNFTTNIIDIFKNKLDTQYNNNEVIEILKEIKNILNFNKSFIPSINTSQINSIESLKLIK